MADKNKTRSSKPVSSSPSRSPIPDTNKLPPAAATGSSEALGHQLMPRPYNITLPPPDNFYFVRLEQLDQLADPTKSKAFEIGLAALFGATGFIQNIWSLAKSWYNKAPVGGWDTLASFIGVALIVLAVTLLIQTRRDRQRAKDLKEEIKSGQKVSVDYAQQQSNK